ncbi:unnamed protein product [Phaedon cochleariae]|uniref:Cathepsin L n=1 Tax=Phaedon cochleariae TaxID=80249 RepID=A0A9P0DNM6_PHACE|nr:unnamed protein product [Phaedon cochleariae]
MGTILIFVCLFFIPDALTNTKEWTNFKEKFGKDYKSTLDEQRRFSIFQENLKIIEAHNEDYRNGKSTYYMGVNQFADMTQEEFINRLGPARNMDISGHSRIMDISTDDGNIPESIDWREIGAVTPVANQGECGSCYIYGALGSIESQHFLKSGKLINLSVQQILDCDEYNNGCIGGWPASVYKQIRENGAVLSEDYQSYQENVGQCQANGTLFKGIGYLSVPRNENALKTAVATYGPVSVEIDASYLNKYSGGVYFNASCNANMANHVLLVVGYGTENGQDYWLARNSWGTTFGIEGYVKMARNRNNNCAIANAPTLPIL